MVAIPETLSATHRTQIVRGSTTKHEQCQFLDPDDATYQRIPNRAFATRSRAKLYSCLVRLLLRTSLCTSLIMRVLAFLFTVAAAAAWKQRAMPVPPRRTLAEENDIFVSAAQIQSSSSTSSSQSTMTIRPPHPPLISGLVGEPWWIISRPLHQAISVNT